MKHNFETLPIDDLTTPFHFYFHCFFHLEAKDGRRLFTVRSENWNEKLGVVNTNEVALVQGNQNSGNKLSNITLSDFLKNSKIYGKYIGIQNNLSSPDLDQKCSIRFQTTFLPIQTDSPKIEFSAKSYNYQTKDAKNPKNLILLANSQGIALQPDGVGSNKILHQRVDENGKIERFWLEAEKTDFEVGGSQEETVEEKLEAERRGKASGKIIGTRAMGMRVNALLTVQIPLKQKKIIQKFQNQCHCVQCEGNNVNGLKYSAFKNFGQTTSIWYFLEIYLPKIILKISKNDQISEPDQNF